jgi:hypothetical protein
LCRVYARLRGPEVGQDCQLGGALVGPTCRYGETLIAKFALRDRGPGESLLAEAVIPEPCFWTPDMPHLYEAHVELRRDGQPIASAARVVGIRNLGVRGRKLIYDGQRWVLRGASVEFPTTDFAPWRDSGTAMVVRCPDDALCDEASRGGVLLVATLQGHEADQIRRLARWPAVSMAIFPSGTHVDLSGLKTNLLLAERFPPGQPIAPQPWSSVAVCGIDDARQSIDAIARCPVAVIAARPAGKFASVPEARRLCDRLQSDLAIACEAPGSCDPAGYIV